MKIDILTTFPDMFTGPLTESIIKRAVAKGLVEISIHNLRDYTEDSRQTTDDRPYGGGPGMVMMIEPIDKAITKIKLQNAKCKIIVMSARGKSFNQQVAYEYKDLDQLIIVAGHYEGIDQRVIDYLADEEVSIGNFVLTGGELPAMVITDAVVRLLPGVLGDENSLNDESHNVEGYKESPHYTRPEEYKGMKVPEVLLSGDHKKIEEWRKNGRN